MPSICTVRLKWAYYGAWALRRHPYNHRIAWNELKEYVKEKYGFNHDGNNIPWVTQQHHSNSITTYFYRGEKCIGEVQVNDDGMILGSIDYTSPRDDVIQSHPYNCLPRHIEDFAASIS